MDAASFPSSASLEKLLTTSVKECLMIVVEVSALSTSSFTIFASVARPVLSRIGSRSSEAVSRVFSLSLSFLYRDLILV